MPPFESAKSHNDEQSAALDLNQSSPQHLISVAMGFWRSTLLISAHELGIFAALSEGPSEAQCLSARLGLCSQSAAEFLEELVANRLLQRDGDRYQNTADAALYLNPARPDYIGAWLRMAGAAMRDMPQLTQHLRAAQPMHGTDRTLGERLWADIASILGESGAVDAA
jgi:hypothetical protein